MYNRFGIIISLIWLLFSCRKESACFHSHGVTQEIPTIIDLDDFKHLILEGNDVVLNLVKDTLNYAEIYGGENAVQFIHTNINDDKLLISNQNRCNWLRNSKKRVQIDLHFKYLESIRNVGDGEIINSNLLILDTLSIHQNGTGNISLEVISKRIWVDLYVIGNVTLSGETKSLIAVVGSYGHLLAKDLKAGWVNVKTVHEGDAHVFPIGGLSATCEKIGNIYYYNEIINPIIKENKQGKVIFIVE